MTHTNLDFSKAELKTLKERDIFYAKIELTNKIDELFNHLKEHIQASKMHQAFPYAKQVDVETGKVSRGERYMRLPYINMDFPKYFSKTNTFTYRTMFWWGNHFSFTLHIHGKPLDDIRSLLQKNLRKLKNKDVYFCIGPAPWNYTFAEQNYKQVERINEPDWKEMIIRRPFIKLSRKVEVSALDGVDLVQFGLQTYEIFLKAIQK